MTSEHAKSTPIPIEVANDFEDVFNQAIEQRLAGLIAQEPQFQNLDIFKQARLENTILGQFFGYRSYDDVEPGERDELIKKVARIKVKFDGIESSLDIHYALHPNTLVTFFEAMRVRPLT